MFVLSGITMDLAHIHLLLNHFPVIGDIMGAGLFVLSLIGKSDNLKLASLVVLLGTALVSVAFMEVRRTGSPSIDANRFSAPCMT